MVTQFGDKLKKLREEKAWSQERFAEELDVSRQSVYKWEANKAYPSIDKLILISRLFDVTVDELIKDEEALGEEKSVDDQDGDPLFDQIHDPGFYIGIVLIILGAFLFDGDLSITLMIIGALTIIFFTDMVKSLMLLFKQTKTSKEENKG